MTAPRRPPGKPGKPVNVQRRLFVLDTNVLMHDPTSIFRFQEHDVYLPMVVLEELDANKKGLSEASRNVRQVSRFLDDLMRDATKEQIDAGLPLDALFGANGSIIPDKNAPSPGRLFFQTNLKATRRWAPNSGGAVQTAAAGQAALANGSQIATRRKRCVAFCFCGVAFSTGSFTTDGKTPGEGKNSGLG